MSSGESSPEPGPSQKRKFSKEDFYFDEVIGHGRYSKVWLAREKTHDFYVAIKIVDGELRKKKKMDTNLFMEAYLHGQLKHPNIIRRFTSFTEGKTLYSVLEYASKGSLYDLLKGRKYRRLSEDLAAKYVYQTASALIECHSYGYLHGDVKPENILIDHHYDAKLADFGMAWPHASGKKRGYCGTTEYLAPEVLKGEDYNRSIDIWSLGVLCYELLCGRNPFKSTRLKITRDRIEEVKYNFPKLIKDDARDLISKLLVLDPKARLGLKQVITHPWITKNYLDLLSSPMEM